nr:MAG TPA: Preprotein translocase subunit [Caudoviricetes sp.]
MIYCLQIGQRVKLANGMIAEITDIDTKTDYLYPLTGEVSIDGGFKRQMLWTKTGHYYTSEHPSPRDIVEVVSG